MEERSHKSEKKKKRKKKVMQEKDNRSHKLTDFMLRLQDIHRNYELEEKLFEDSDFPHLYDSLFRDEEKVKKMNQEYKSIQWKRPQDIHKEAKFCVNPKGKCDMKFGAVSDGIFTGALAMVSIHPCIENVIVDADNIKMGYAAFQFFKNGEWRYVIVDTSLPYSDISKCHIFSECHDSKEFWVQLLEKAYAKLNGCYEYIQDMDMREVLVDLTGGVCEMFKLGLDKGEGSLLSGMIYNKMVNALKHKYILGCIKMVPGKRPNVKDTGDRGILENHYHGMMMIREVRIGPS